MPEEMLLNLAPAEWCVSFYPDGKAEIGRLTLSEQGKLQFEGDAEESAKAFFNFFLFRQVEQYIEKRLAAEGVTDAGEEEIECQRS